MIYRNNKLRTLGAAAIASTLVLSGCAGTDVENGSVEAETTELTFTTWAGESESIAFKEAIEQFESENEGVTVAINVVPYSQMFSGIDAKLSSGTAPDIFRVDYGNLGVYSSQDQLLNLTPYLQSEEDKFIPAMWQAVSYDGNLYGVPHQTDVSALLVNTDMLSEAGVDVESLPMTQADAWSWDEFAAVSQQLRAELPADKYPFAFNWQLGGAPRWLSWLFQANGAIFEADGVTPAIDSPAGEKALNYTKRFFEDGWVPPTSSTKSSVYADTLFQEGTAAMVFAGSFLIPDMETLAPFNWTALPMPRDERGATDLGGNALVATKDTENPDLAAKFLAFMVQADSMLAFCAATNELPTRTDIDGDSIAFVVRPDVMPVFVEQAATIEPSDVAQLTSPAMAAISTALQDQLEAAFVGGQSTEDTLDNLTRAIEEATN